MTIDPATVRTYAPGSWSVTLCLATRWFGDDPCPTVCGREEHEDPWHVSAKYSTTSEPVTWEEEESLRRSEAEFTGASLVEFGTKEAPNLREQTGAERPDPTKEL